MGIYQINYVETQLKTSKIVENALKDAYEVFELFYEETN